MTTPSELDTRYGRTPASKRRTRWLLVGAAGAFVVVFAAWLLWAGVLAPAAQFESKDTGHQILSDSEVSVTWQFIADPDVTASCAVQALNSTFGIVGWKIVQLPPSSERIREFTETVRTSELAVTGLIYRCWLT